MRHTVSYEVDDGVAVVTLPRPGQRLDGLDGTGVPLGLRDAEHDDAVGAIVLTGAGRSFCVGADTRALDGIAEQQQYIRFAAAGARITTSFTKLGLPGTARPGCSLDHRRGSGDELLLSSRPPSRLWTWGS